MADILLGNVKGPQGPQGDPGIQGETGSAATIEIGSVSTTAYGNTASVTNSGTEQDAVLDFVIPQGKPGEQTTRMGALTLDTITAQSADFPIPAVGETGSTVFGKIIKFFNSTISALNSKLNISDVVNNLTSTSTTKPLSAAQGKALNDALTWKEVGIVTGGSSNLTIPVGWKEANVRVGLGGQRYFVISLSASNFNFAEDTTYNIRDGYYANSGNSAYVSFALNTKTTKASTAILVDAILTGADVLSSTTMQIRYR